MKKIYALTLALIAIFCCTLNMSAEQRTEVSKGIYVVTYGNVTVVENDNTQQTVRIKVQKKDDSLYDILCGDTVVKTVAKAGLKAGLAYSIQTYTAIPAWLSAAVIGRIVDKAYDGACDYFR